MKKIISIVLLVSYSALAQVQYVQKNESVPYDGYLFSPDKEIEARQSVLNLDYQKLLNDSQARQVDLYKKENGELTNRLNLYKSSNDELYKRAMDSTNKGFWSGFWYFLLGAGVTTLITYGVNHK